MKPGFKPAVQAAFLLNLMMLVPLAFGQVNIAGPRHLSMRPGETKTVEYRITNTTPEPVQASIFFNDYAQMPDGSLVHIPAKSLPQSLFHLAELDRLEYVLPPGSSSAVPLTLTVPAEALGGYWGVIGVETPPPPTPEGANAVSFNIRYAMVTDLEVESVVQHQVSIDNIATTQEGRQAVVLTLRNAGSSYQRYQLSVAFEGASGESATVESDAVILPGLTVDLEVPIPETLPSGPYGVFATLIYNNGMRAEAVSTAVVPEQRPSTP